MVSSKKLVLVVDDNEDIRFLVKTWLTNAGFSVVTAVDGDDLIKKLDKNIDLVLTDFHMPGPDPKIVLDSIKKKSPKAKIIYLTGSVPDVMIKSPVVGFISKPVEEEVLIKKLKELFLKNK
ncbi:Sensor histidine kinase RcsC [Candidatus Tiddalikarchaeum anstoanum]|nr:Sensor histidine kinase RcsC [Candidatus Tiddalikarchaeum anstoanum]